MGFEVERFEWTSDGRLELAGRWFDVRGQRFLRPTLEVQVNGATRRLLATLEHKPWAAEEGEEWLAAFPWDGEMVDIEGAQLIVGPSPTVEVGRPATPGGREDSRRPRDAGRELAAARAEVKRLRAGLEREREELRKEMAGLRERVANAEASHKEMLREAYEQAASTRSGGGLDQAKAERERDAAAAEAEALAAALEETNQERDAMAAALEETRRERDEARARLSSVGSEIDAALRARDEAREDRDLSLSRAPAAEAEGDGLRDRPTAMPAAAVPERSATRVLGPEPLPLSRDFPVPPTRKSREVRWVVRLMVILALILVVAALLLVLT